MAKQRHKRKKKYTVMLISNLAEGKSKQYHLSSIISVFILLMILGMSLAGSAVFGVINYLDASSIPALPKISFRSSQVATEQIAELKENISQLEQEKKNMEEQISFLSSAVSQKEDKLSVLQAENEVRNKPTGFPLNGNATIYFDGLLDDYLHGDEAEAGGENPEEQQDEDAAQQENPEEVASTGAEEYIVVFEAAEGVAVVATGYGTIATITEDEELGHCVTVDHGNGYVSYYFSKAEPKVREGSEVARGTVLYELEDVSKVGYQIKQDDQFVNPLSVMEIAG